ncbi:MAG: branched-chain amino acid ABC transporter substrate-binding protein, partial [Candidatus Eisenbacteria bacterium]|nr:branched-chain amino acid ABC transporter substrate-binding protein [Candidatus Eisenbacteria bacterium]
MRSRFAFRPAHALVVLLACALAGCGGGGGGSSKDELVIGEYGSMTGGDADFGQSTKRGVDL